MNKEDKKWLELIHADLQAIRGESKLQFSMIFFFSLWLIILTIFLISISANNSSYNIILVAGVFIAAIYFMLRSKNRREGGILVVNSAGEIKKLEKELGLEEIEKYKQPSNPNEMQISKK